jgi:hypothetical protein
MIICAGHGSSGTIERVNKVPARVLSKVRLGLTAANASKLSRLTFFYQQQAARNTELSTDDVPAAAKPWRMSTLLAIHAEEVREKRREEALARSTAELLSGGEGDDATPPKTFSAMADGGERSVARVHGGVLRELAATAAARGETFTPPAVTTARTTPDDGELATQLSLLGVATAARLSVAGGAFVAE